MPGWRMIDAFVIKRGVPRTLLDMKDLIPMASIMINVYCIALRTHDKMRYPLHNLSALISGARLDSVSCEARLLHFYSVGLFGIGRISF